MKKIPATILTGFLGAGKTTLLNNILQANAGEQIAIIVNEFGEINIDSQLIHATDEAIVELSNGCICCTVLQDLAIVFGFASTVGTVAATGQSMTVIGPHHPTFIAALAMLVGASFGYVSGVLTEFLSKKSTATEQSVLAAPEGIG